MSKTKQGITPQVDMFCSFYTAIGSDTFSHAEKSAIAAGYSEASAGNQATKLLKKPDVRKRIVELNAENMDKNMVTVNKVLADLEHDKLMARNKGDYASAIRADELQGKYLALFTDRYANAPSPEAQQELDAEQKAEAQRIINIRLRDMSQGDCPQDEAITPQTVAASI